MIIMQTRPTVVGDLVGSGVKLDIANIRTKHLYP